jgi:hypothetical protein
LEFRQTVASGLVTALNRPLLTVLDSHQKLAENGPGVETDRALCRMTESWADFASSDVDNLSPLHWTLAASGLHAAGSLVSARDEYAGSGDRVRDLFSAASEFFSHTRRNAAQRRSVTAQDLFFNDRALADMILTLKGWWTPGTVEPEALENLAAVLAGVGLASGATFWLQKGAYFSNFAGAVWVFFDESDGTMLRNVKLLRPSVYFQAAAAWRPGSLGYQELILANLMDGYPPGRTLGIVRDALEINPGDEALRRAQAILTEADEEDRGPLETAKTLAVELAPESIFSGKTDANLPAFLRMAFEPQH